MEINILGYGVMGRQISSLLILMGYKVNIFLKETLPEEVVLKNIKKIARFLSLELKEINFTLLTDITNLPNAITIECISENIEDKKLIYNSFNNINNKPYLTNTSSFSPSEIGENVSGIHFFNPITIKLVEIYMTSEHSLNNELLQLIESFKEIEFDVVGVNDNRAYIANFILFEEISTAIKLIEKYQYDMKSILQVYKHLYNGRNVFDIIDVVGIDITYNILNNLKEIDDSIYVPELLKEALNNGYLGKKNKKTFKSFLENKEKN
ncbi:3-hydroxyacyl-CoA dehydrogenase NAD-binding domain-containing protein [Aliarcobacter cryaerophilus]|uniref:3-hydroxyacyl-CoA dehydrogenase NAD-binding domain-containing protein n=1 Tax=Aliarcobacter cryaerophilus TaxID=28198 RepID=UPI003DA4FE62